ncbi:putative glutamine amidotransferase [Kineococcus rhizosphaerae]|uniref:Putative glutamine amidotransferase n=1 Tax=Kineococcus rhizosphaerae TaxID=559628 RepID=A0A2T0QUR6_9ACTN|nr:putative glutamine amidotransferase [Kineococcus rhizosphaerae]
MELPYESAGHEILTRLDGLVVTGGQDVDPRLWGGDPALSQEPFDPDRDRYEAGLLRHAVALGVPTLAICRGVQLLNVAFGGTLVGDLPHHDIDHTSPDYPVEAETHDVILQPGSLAAGLYGPRIAVNSLHHQAVADCPSEFLISGRAPDGTAEVLEMPGHPVLGVQWHPEWRTGDDQAFTWLVNCSLDRAWGIDVAS